MRISIWGDIKRVLDKITDFQVELARDTSPSVSIADGRWTITERSPHDHVPDCGALH
jgi:hypothetical protein